MIISSYDTYNTPQRNACIYVDDIAWPYAVRLQSPKAVWLAAF